MRLCDSKSKEYPYIKIFPIECRIVIQQVKQLNKYNQFHFFNILNKEKRTPKENVEKKEKRDSEMSEIREVYVDGTLTTCAFMRKKKNLRRKQRTDM